jgi:hypothetical protein
LLAHVEDEPTTAQEVKRGVPAGSAKVEQCTRHWCGGQAREDEPGSGADVDIFLLW